MMINSKVAIIIVNWKKYDITSSCIESILNSTNSNFKIILIDNESDNKDEVLVPLDYQTSGLIRDDTIYANLVKKIPTDCKLFSLIDVLIFPCDLGNFGNLFSTCSS